MYKILLGFTASDESYENFEEAQRAAFNLATEHQLQPEIIEVKGKVILKPIFIPVEEEAVKILDNFPPAPPEPKAPAKKKQKVQKVEELKNEMTMKEYIDKEISKRENSRSDETIKENVEVLEPKDIEVDFANGTIKQTFEINNIDNPKTYELVNDIYEIAKEKSEEITEEITPLEQAIEEVKKTEEKIYTTSLGMPIKESILKTSCKHKFKFVLDQEKTAEAFKGVVKSLVALYPEIDSEEWFEDMVNEQIKVLSPEEEEKYIKSFLVDKVIEKIEKVTSPEELQEITKNNPSLTDGAYIRAFQAKSDEFSEKDLATLTNIINNKEYEVSNLEAIYKLPKYQALSLTRYKDEYNKLADIITQKKKIELQVEQLLSKLPTAKNPVELLKNYSEEVQNHHKIENYFTQNLGIFPNGSEVPF